MRWIVSMTKIVPFVKLKLIKFETQYNIKLEKIDIFLRLKTLIILNILLLILVLKTQKYNIFMINFN